MCFCSHNYGPCNKSKNDVNGQAFSYFALGIDLVLKVKIINRNTVVIRV